LGVLYFGQFWGLNQGLDLARQALCYLHYSDRLLEGLLIFANPKTIRQHLIVFNMNFPFPKIDEFWSGAGGSPVCNPSYSGGRDQEDHGLKPARQIVL
jgi:hypothetical protein